MMSVILYTIDLSYPLENKGGFLSKLLPILLMVFLIGLIDFVPVAQAQSNPQDSSYKVIKRTSKIEMYRCDDCHATKKDYKPSQRKLEEEHSEIKIAHVADEEEEWCLRCHKKNNYNKLYLQSGEAISFNESYKLCRECHSTIYKDWLENAHGKRIGSWQDVSQAYSCTECHDAHDPKIKPMDSKKPPLHPINTFWGL